MSPQRIEGDVLSHEELRFKLRERAEWATYLHKIRFLWENKDRILSEVRCLQAEACGWPIISYGHMDIQHRRCSSCAEGSIATKGAERRESCGPFIYSA